MQTQNIESTDISLLANKLREGAIGVLATDTLFGVVGSALLPQAVERIFDIKQRNTKKPLIILIATLEQMQYFGIELTNEVLHIAKKYWPGRYTIIFPTQENERFAYLTRGTGELAFRMPDRADLHDLIMQAGPIVAPSANREGESPAASLEEARTYFGTAAQFYVETGTMSGEASKILRYRGNGEVKIVRN